MRVENHLGLATKVAMDCWRRLPAHARGYLEPEDLVQDALLVMRESLLPKWDCTRSKFSTYAYRSLVNMFANRLVDFYRIKRLPTIPAPVQASPSSQSEYFLVSRQYRKMFAEASPPLQELLAGAFGCPFPQTSVTPRTRFRLHGAKWQKLKIEFKALCRDFRLDEAEFRLLLQGTPERTQIIYQRG